MALITIKQVAFPLLESIILPPPPAPDPYERTFFGGYNDGSGVKLYIYKNGDDGFLWYEATLQDQISNVPNFITDKSNVFFSKTDAFAQLIDLRFLTNEVLKIENSGSEFYEGNQFVKEVDSDTIIMQGTNSLNADTEYLVTIKSN